MGDSKGRGNARYKAENARLRVTTLPVCRWCFRPIDLSLRWPDPLSWSADHVIPLDLGGPLHGERAPMHLKCNSARGISPLPPLPADTTTEAW